METVKKILDVTAWPDKSKPKIETYLAGPASENSKKAVRHILKTFDFHINEKNEILSKGDLDVNFSRGMMMQNLGPLFRQLKNIVSFSDEEITYFATKGSASWAIASNAQQHEKVQQFLEAEIPQLKGASLLEALLSVAEAQLNRNEDDRAFQTINRFLELNPASARANHFLLTYYLKAQNQEGVIRQIQILENLAPDLAAEIKSMLAPK